MHWAKPPNITNKHSYIQRYVNNEDLIMFLRILNLEIFHTKINCPFILPSLK